MPKKNSSNKPVQFFLPQSRLGPPIESLSGTMRRSKGDVVEVAVDRMYREEIRFGGCQFFSRS